MTPAVLSASTLKGDAIVNPAGDKLGSLKELMIDVADGKIAYAVLSRGGFGRLGERLFAVPWDLLTVDGDQKCLVLDVDEDVLEDSPGFDPDNWPTFSDSAWRQGVDRHFGVGRSTTPTQTTPIDRSGSSEDPASTEPV
ncbi:MAG TPA: PRC-barrel domain-containing protein [Acidimicrobiia bacterium]|jgi:sporulation protein YlmC with PRC-barrel domain|nr:PRC-barrel domain-containing protein [Acidimicrobiia bacterium]